MANTFELGITLQVIDSVLGSFTLTPPLQLGTAYFEEKNLVLANGDNTITCPTTAHTWVLILFDPTSATTKKLKGVGGDTGISIFTLPIALFGSPGSAATFVINSSAVDTGKTTRIIFF